MLTPATSSAIFVPEIAVEVGHLSASAKGLGYVLSLGLSTAWAFEVREQVAQLTDDEARLYRASGYVLGDVIVYRARSLKTAPLVQRSALVRAARTTDALLPTGREVSVAIDRRLDRAAYLALGYPIVGERAVRADVLERSVQRIRATNESERSALPIATWLGMPPRQAFRVWEEMRDRLGAD